MGSKLKYLFTASASIPVSRSCFKFLLWFLPVVDCALSDVSWNKHFLPQVALVMVFYDSSKNPRICPIRISRIGKMNHLNSKARLRKGDIPGRHASEREVIYKNFPVKPFLFFFLNSYSEAELFLFPISLWVLDLCLGAIHVIPYTGHHSEGKNWQMSKLRKIIKKNSWVQLKLETLKKEVVSESIKWLINKTREASDSFSKNIL